MSDRASFTSIHTLNIHNTAAHPRHPWSLVVRGQNQRRMDPLLVSAVARKERIQPSRASHAGDWVRRRIRILGCRNLGILGSWCLRFMGAGFGRNWGKWSLLNSGVGCGDLGQMDLSNSWSCDWVDSRNWGKYICPISGVTIWTTDKLGIVDWSNSWSGGWDPTTVHDNRGATDYWHAVQVVDAESGEVRCIMAGHTGEGPTGTVCGTMRSMCGAEAGC